MQSYSNDIFVVWYIVDGYGLVYLVYCLYGLFVYSSSLREDLENASGTDCTSIHTQQKQQ